MLAEETQIIEIGDEMHVFLVLIEGYNQAIEDQKYYAENVSKGARVLEEYYSL